MRTSFTHARSCAGPSTEPTVIGDVDDAAGARLGPARLVVVHGALAGATVPLGDDETTIGRARANDVVLPDISVSRRHAVLRREVDGYVVVDRASGNGTRINGRSIQTARLRDGDELALGDSVVQFVDAGGLVARSSVAARTGLAARHVRQSRGRTWTAIGLPLLTTVVIAAVGRRDQRPRLDPPGPAQRAAPVEPVERQEPRSDVEMPAPTQHAAQAGLEANAARAGATPRSASAAAGQLFRTRRLRPSARSRVIDDDAPDRTAPEQLQGPVAEANDAYLRGYVAKDIDEEAAREAFRSVVELLPASDPTARKARRWLERLDGKAGEED
jgi:predicted component of type VI protein secretion system